MKTTLKKYAKPLLSVTLLFSMTLSILPPITASAAEPVVPDETRPTYLGKSLYTGEFHAHTSVSDGVKLPPDAFEYVHDKTQADFFAVTEHDVMWDIRNGDDFIDDWRDAASEEWRYVHERAFAFNESQDDLVAVPAIENTWYDGTGHINVFNSDWHATARATEKGSVDGFLNSFGTGNMMYDLYTFYARLKQDPDAIAQFNHPNPTSKGDFFGFKGLDPVTDERMELIEVKTDGQFGEFQKALDAGWHLGPVWNGDEHSDNWVTSNESITGVWAEEHSLEGLYAAMRDRSVFSTLDVNTALEFSANDKLMGAILPADTTSLSFDISVTDADAGDAFTSVKLYTNGGRVAREFTGVNGRDVHLTAELPSSDGDYFYVRADQADGDFVVSAPIWVGEKTRGANYAPAIVVDDEVPTLAKYGQSIELPKVTAVDDSGVEPNVAYEVYDSTGKVPVADGAFEIRSYDDAFIVVKATDATGNTNAELIRIQVDKDGLDPAGVFQYFGSTAAVTEKPGGAGIAVSTDRTVGKVYAQVMPADSNDWSSASVLASANDKPYEVNAIGNDESEYQYSITGQTLRSHEFDVTGLDAGETYKYRFGVAVDGTAPNAGDTDAWTETKGEFTTGGSGNEPIYVVGDLQATTHDASDLGLFGQVVDRLEAESPGGGTLIQTGDLVDNGGRGQYWDEIFDHVWDGLDVQIAPVVGNHETYGDLDYDVVNGDRTAIFSNMYDLPKNGAIGESNYSFERGDVHVAVLNSNFDMDEQLAWLKEDIRSSTKKWNVVTGHFSYYGGQHGDDAGLAADRPKITAALDALGVDLYIGGHDHVYKRSTIYDGRLAATPNEEALGTTYVTMGSAGPKFYDNTVHWWDDVVFDEDTQMGGVLEVTDDGLRIATYTLDGRVVDDYTVRKPSGEFRIGSTEIANRELEGVGLLSYEGSRDSLALIAATYDSTQTQLHDIRSVDVELDHQGREQFVTFDSPLPVKTSDVVKLFVWDKLGNGKPLIPSLTLREGIAGDGTEEDPYLIQSAADFGKIVYDPKGHYRLAKDLDLGNAGVRVEVPFGGEFDGAGHALTGFSSTEGGLFAILAAGSSVHDLAIVDANVKKSTSTVGILVDSLGTSINALGGTVERVWTSGTVSGPTYVAGIAGTSFGTIRDTYSTANVTASGTYAGGIIGVADSPSMTERVYATGKIISGSTAGGLTGYARNSDVTVRDSFALNPTVTGSAFAQRVVARFASGQTAALENNYAAETVSAATQSNTATGPTTLNGATKTTVETRDVATWQTGLGWDFDSVWQWNDNGSRPVLQSLPEQIAAPPTAPALERDADGAYLVAEAGDFAELDAWPAERFRLASDLDLSGVDVRVDALFMGELDGAGHVLTGFKSTAGGLFASLRAGSSVHDLGIAGAEVSKSTSTVGILVDSLGTSASALGGTVERVWTSGTVIGPTYVAGIAGTSFGTIRDSYSTADATATTGNYAAGIIGVADSPSMTERVYATGKITAVSTAGGLTGYARNSGVTVRNSFALNPSVTGSAFAQRVVARFASGQTAVLGNNYAAETVSASVQSNTPTGPTTLNGATKTTAETRDVATWQTGLGWDFDAVWQWDAATARPVLRATGSASVKGAAVTGALEVRASVMEVVYDAISHEAAAGEDGMVSLTLNGGASAAGQRMSVLVLKKDAYVPLIDDVAYLNEVMLDASGAVQLSVRLPDENLDEYAIALNTTGESTRYVASLDVEWSSVDSVTVTPSTATVQKGSMQAFSATVNGKNDPEQSVTWSVYGTGNAGTTISSSGVLTIAADEAAEVLTVKAASTVDPAKFGMATVTVKTDENNDTGVTSVTVTPSTATVHKGGMESFSATVNGANNPEQSVIWSVYGTGNAGTTISGSGVLMIAADETAEVLTVKAASTVDPAKFGTANVTVTEEPVQPIVLQSIVQPSNIAELANGTPKTAEAFGLPTSVTLATYGGSTTTMPAAVHWNVASSSYNPSSASAQTFPVNGTVTLPSGVTNPDNVPLTVSVSVSVKAQVRSETPPPTYYTITASAGENGSISPSGTVSVINGGSQSFTIKANDGYQIAGVTADGQNIGKVSTYSFSNVTASHSISATFVKEEVVVTPPDESTGKPTDKPTDMPSLEDVKEGAWYNDDVEYVIAHGLMRGTGDHTFSPNMELTRGMVATILGQHYGLDVSKYGENSFEDVDDNKYYAPYVEWVRDAGIAGGIGSNKFDPDAPIMRQDLAVILMRYAGVAGLNLPVVKQNTGFKDDADISTYAKDAVKTFFMAGIFTGKPGGIFDPKGVITRAEVAAILHRFIETAIKK
ncbi:S-layer homology domain-containing protein [Cohnella lupini]|uniref:3',5'-cyclic AMP phosphodiesterase CpdA n=1 Tax=Cohnella lupini TaxID=1294267 RepID=A0A3D9INE8_9BACL|nr:S-layer homology domain-containing protein [Cohnella lupini]RED63039.1 3',5'-cyclic AMP phosphodiesterase CpdA [Cohnella lupini]